MFAKIVLFCAALAATQASLIAPIGLGAPVLAAGHLGYGKGLIAAAPAIATLSSQKTAINHVAPAAGIAVATAPVALVNNGILGNGLVAGHGIRSAPLAIGSGLLGSPYGIGAGYHGLGYGAAINTASTQKSVINHVAPVAAAPVVVANHGVLTNGLVAGQGIASNGVVTGNGIFTNGLVAGHGIRTAPIAVSTGLLGASYGLGAGHGLGYGATINTASTQKSVINHVAPVVPQVTIAAAPVSVASHGILANGLVAGHGIGAAPLAISTGLLGAPYGHGAGYGLGYGAALNAASTQKSVINHVAPAAPVAVSAAPVAVVNHGILANGLVAGAPLGIAGHGIAAHPLAIGSGLHGAPVGLGLGKVLL
ncbi:uncharacterized protein NPIL_154351 [Nephila pilipes]|uniref:Uncharacterized protein n=1 Tax=Nephila pilipes TaxID=299642 RepID=A0A8X6QFT4_NEPPI|nr:uncharacterized protein NPIL_154351 [Nephila pilipes]